MNYKVEFPDFDEIQVGDIIEIASVQHLLSMKNHDGEACEVCSLWQFCDAINELGVNIPCGNTPNASFTDIRPH